MPNISDKNRPNMPATIREQENLNGLTIGKPLPSEYIPGIDVTNYIDPSDNINPGDPDSTGIFGYWKQTVWDKLFGGNTPPGDAAKFRPKSLMANSNAASSVSQVVRVVVDSQGTNYSGSTIVAFSGGGGTGATASPIISGGKIVGVQITNPGSNYTSAPTVSFVDTTGSGATATAIVSLGGKISSSLIFPEDNSFAALLDPITGKYLGGEFYTKQEVMDLLGNSGNTNLIYFNDFDQGLGNANLFQSSSTYPYTQEFVTVPQSGVPNDISSRDLPGGAVLVGVAGGDTGTRLYLYDYIAVTSTSDAERTSNAIGVYTLVPKYSNTATQQWLAVAFPKRRIVNYYGGDRQLIVRAKWPVSSTYDATKTFYIGYAHDNGSWNIIDTPIPLRFQLKFKDSTLTLGGGYSSAYTECTEIVCNFGGTLVTVASPGSKLGTYKSEWSMLKITLSENIVNGGLIDQTAKFYVNDVLVATITKSPVEMYLFPFFAATGGNTSNNNMMAVDFIEDMAILPVARGNNTNRVIPTPV